MRKNVKRKKVVLITGAGRRLGKKIALACAQAGFNVVVNYSESETGANQVVRAIKKLGCDAIAIRGDIADRKSVV
jgi:3-oxoacyl-[acyl-carrier protein] reductase